MSGSSGYSLFFSFRPISADDSTAWSEFQSHIMGMPLNPEKRELPEEVLRLYAGFYLQFPKLFRKKKKNGKRAKKSDLEEIYLGHNCEYMSMIRIPLKYAPDVVPFAFDLARSLGVTLIDPNTGHIHRVDGFEGVRMKVEGEPDFISPNFRQICDAVDGLTFNGGPSFIILGTADKSYAQTAGGDGHYTCEWRQYSGKSFKHWVAGRTDSNDGEVSIKTNGSQLIVNSNEHLTANEVKQIFLAFARQESRPTDWKWRNISGQFN